MYVPPPGRWETKAPDDLGLDEKRPDEAFEYHLAHDSKWATSFLADGRYIGVSDEPDPLDGVDDYVPGVLGPVRPRGGPNGLVLRHGVIAAEWGDTRRADMTFSVAKSYLSILAGI